MKLARITLPMSILGVAGGASWWLIASQPQPATRPEDARVHPVKAARVAPEDYRVMIESRGIVRPRTESALVSEVSGQIIEINSSLREGGFFEKGESLLRIDPRDYETAVTIARSELAKAERSLEEETARADQAVEDWKRLGRGGDVPALVARVPQLAEARAVVASAQAGLDRASRTVERTVILAPYAGCVLEKLVDIGQVVTSGTKLAGIYAVDFAEVELPLTLADLGFLDLPESYRGEKPDATKTGPAVVLHSDYGGRRHSWDGTVVRAAGAIDRDSRQLFVTAQVANPYGRRQRDVPPLKAGLFVEAEINGHTLSDVFVIPRAAVRDGSLVLLIDETNRLRRRPLEIVWSASDHVVASTGLQAGDVICLTRLPLAIDGLRVKPEMVELPAPARHPNARPPLTRGEERPRDKSA